MADALKKETRPSVIKAEFFSLDSKGLIKLKRFEGTLFHDRTSSVEEVLGSLAIEPALDRMVPTAEVSFIDSVQRYVLDLRSSNHGFQRLVEDPDGLLEEVLADGKIYEKVQ